MVRYKPSPVVRVTPTIRSDGLVLRIPAIIATGIPGPDQRTTAREAVVRHELAVQLQHEAEAPLVRAPAAVPLHQQDAAEARVPAEANRALRLLMDANAVITNNRSLYRG